MTFWKKLVGIKELPKADLTKKNQTRPSVTSKPQAPQAVGAKEDAPELTEKLGEAARTGDVIEIRNLLNNGAIVNARTRDGVTALHSAAMFGHKAVAELLLANGANVNAKNSYGETPLERAVRYLNKCSKRQSNCCAGAAAG